MFIVNKTECAITTIKILATLLIVNLIATVFGLEYSPFYWLSNFTHDTLPFVQEDKITESITQKWAMRGQIGDIMSGHFSALSVLAISYSIMLQVEANKKMTKSIKQQEEALRKTDLTIQQQNLSIEKQTEANLEQAKSTLQQALAIELQAKSIEQQNEALKVQSKSLESQIEELKASREENEKQTEEFFIQNVNVKLDRYYNLLDKFISKVNNKLLEDYVNAEKRLLKYTNEDKELQKINAELIRRYSITFDNVILILNLIFEEIENIKYIYPNSHKSFSEEYTLILSSHKYILSRIKRDYTLSDNCKALDLVNYF